MSTLRIPTDLLPADGRFGCGPAKIPGDAVDRLAAAGRTWLGTSHRQAPVRDVVARIQRGLAELYRAPDGYHVALGNGGSTLFWDAAVSSLIERRSAHGVFGEFSSKFAQAVAAAPHLDEPAVFEAAPGSVALPEPTDADAYAWAHNETSTGALAPVQRPDADGLVLIDGTSAAGGVQVDLSQTDAYYFAPQKGLASDGGLWVAFLSPAALERIERIAAGDRWIPAILSLQQAVQNSAAHQTLNTPALTTLFLLADRVDQLLADGGLEAAEARSRTSSDYVYRWAEERSWASPFVEEPYRSPVVGTIDFAPEVDAAAVAATLRANGVVDTEPYRKLGRNQLRIGMFPTIDPADVEALCACIDWVVENG
ncbi:phosphoserine transaminase [Enemella sp. A6]|uniref:phosphoserine transaminase n=1 Tax=Enemella sp. A6 TaxID=3440152 RepID=UPI003EC1104B